MSGKIPVSSGQPNPSFKVRYDLWGGVISCLAILGLFGGIAAQYVSVWKGGQSGSNEIKDYMVNSMAYIFPTFAITLAGWYLFVSYSSSVNKATWLWIMGIFAIILSNIALVASLFQVKVVTQY